ncbi:MAG: acetolactate synthase small subunit [Actinomycetota bacterium]
MSLHTISVIVEDKPGVLTRIAGLFAARGFNIDSLAVGPTNEEGQSRMTIVVQVDRKPLEQVTKQLNKLVHVLKIIEHDRGAAVERELLMVKVKAAGESRARILEICDVFRVRPLDLTQTSITVEATGTPEKLEALLDLFADFGIIEVARTGRIALDRGDLGGGRRRRRLAAVDTADPSWSGGSV